MVVAVLVLFRAPLQAVREVVRRVARHFAAMQVEALAEPEIDVLLDGGEVDAADRPHVLGEAGLLHQLTRTLHDARQARVADEHVVRFFGQHETGGSRQRIEGAFRQRKQLRLPIAIGEHREREEIEPGLDGRVERLEHPRLVAVAALPLEQLLGLVAAVAAEVRVEQIDHRPEVTALFDVHLKQVPKVVQARTMMAEHPLLLDARRLGIALRDDEAAELVAELARHLLPCGLALELAEVDPAIGRRLREEDPPAVVGQLHVLEVRPALRVDAHRRPQIHLVVMLEPLRPHIGPPLQVFRLPMLECPLQALVARQVDVVGNAVLQIHQQRLQSNSGRPSRP